MSKKKFKEGLESLFQEEPPVEKEPTATAAERRKAKSSEPTDDKKERPSGGKNFTDDLQSFLQTAFEESYDRQTKARPAKKETFSSEIKKRHAKPMSGLDALIRATVEPSRIKTGAKSTRRLTVAFDEQKLEKLKKIARMEKAYLRDIIDGIVAEYIRTYEQDKGDL